MESHKAWARYYDSKYPSDFVKKCNESRQLQQDNQVIQEVKIPTPQTVQRCLDETVPSSTPR
jgi:hypothetical protein